MFTTMRYVKDSALVSQREGHVFAHIACKACRSRKLKCSGETDGCHRCRAKGITCVYPNSSKRKRSKRKIAPSKSPHNTIIQLPGPSPSRSTENSASSQSVPTPPPTQELTPLVVPDPWTANALQESPGRLILDTFFDDEINQPLYSLGEDFSTEGADFFPLHHFPWIAESVGADRMTTTFDIRNSSVAEFRSEELLANTSSSPTLRYSSLGPQGSRNPMQFRSPSEYGSFLPMSDVTGLTINGATHTEFSNLEAIAREHRMPEGSEIADSSETLTGQAPCRCLRSALNILDAITINEIRSDIGTVPRTIQLNKCIIRQCKQLFDCANCTSASEIMMLLKVICQKLISSYEHVVALLVEQYNHLYNLPEDQVPVCHRVQDAIIATGPKEGDRLQLREYEVEVKEEPCMFVGLITMQLGILKAFLMRLKAVVREQSSGHFIVLDSVDERISKLGRFCSRSCEV